MAKRRIFFAVLLGLTALMIFTNTDLGSRFEIKMGSPNPGINLDLKRRGGLAISKADTLTVEGENIDLFDLTNKFGTVKIIGESRDNVFIQYQVNVTYTGKADPAEVEKYLQEISVQSAIGGRRLIITVDEPADKDQEIMMVWIDYEIYVPSRMSLAITADYCPVEVSGIQGQVAAGLQFAEESSAFYDLAGDLDLKMNYGSADITQVKGDLVLKSHFAHLAVDGIAGKTKVSATYSNLNFTNLGQDLEFTSTFGDLYILGLGGDLKGGSSYTQIDAGELEGRVDLNLSFGSAQLTGLSKDVSVNASYSPLDLTLMPADQGYQIFVEIEHSQLVSGLDLAVAAKSSSVTKYTGSYKGGESIVDIKSKFSPVTLGIDP